MNIRGFLLLLPLLSDVALAIPTTSTPVIVDRIEAIVNKSAIYLSDVKKFRNTSSLRMKVDPLFANNPLSRKQPSDSEIVEYLVSENLILEKFPVNDVELDQEINSIQTNLQISREGLKSAISREGFLFEDYQELMRASIAKRQLIDRDIRNKASVSEDELKTEYNKSKSGSKNFQGSIHLHLIKITKKNYKNIQAAKEILQGAQKELNDGISFSEVAKKTSDDPSSSNGGDLGFLSYQDMNANLQKEVQKFFNSKTKDKFASFEDDQSLNLIQISEISNDVDSGFEKQRDQLRGKLLELEFQHQIELWIDRQKSLNYVKINS